MYVVNTEAAGFIAASIDIKNPKFNYGKYFFCTFDYQMPI